jgi:Icc-related predicted phosphoesterase
MKIIAISDTHCRLNQVKIPDGDILIHAGDLTFRGTVPEIAKELKILKEKTEHFQKVIVTCGNHDWLGETNPELMKQMCEDKGFVYLCDSAITVDGTKIYGSPFQPEFCDWAFNLPRGLPLQEKWGLIPEDTNVLVTHGPPYCILDLCPDGRHVGCMHLRQRIEQLKLLKYHIFGHIHCGYGKFHKDGVSYRNVSVCTEEYLPTNEPTIINIP